MNETVRYQFSPRQNHTHESKTNHCWCLSMASGVKRFFSLLTCRTWALCHL